jgi:hypothetical protein
LNKARPREIKEFMKNWTIENRNGSHNGHAKLTSAVSMSKDRRGEIPMGGDFKDF